MPGYGKFESMKNGGSWGQFCWKTCGSEKVKSALQEKFELSSGGSITCNSEIIETIKYYIMIDTNCCLVIGTNLFKCLVSFSQNAALHFTLALPIGI